MNIWHFGDPQDDSNLPTADSARAAIEKYVVPYYKNIKECSQGLDDYTCGEPASKSGVNYILSSGVGLSVVSDYKSKNLLFVVTVNNIGSDNAREGTDWFVFVAKNGKVLPPGWHDGISREEIFDTGVMSEVWGSNILYSCKEVEEINDESDIAEYSRRACTALLMLDNWEFKDDYPW